MGSLLNKDDDPENFPLLLSGSMSDGQSAAKEVADDGLSYEYDIIYISKIEISDENGIEYVAEAPGYIRIFYDNNSYESHLPTGSLNNQTFIDGYQLKQQIHSIMKEQNLRSISSSSTSIDKANIFFQFSDPNPPIDCNILEKIELFRQNITNEQQQIGRRNIEQFSLYILDVFDKETKYFLCKLSKELFHIDLSNQHINKYHTKIKQLIHLYKTLYLSLAGIPMPSNLTHKLRLILNFYEQYRHLVDENALESQFEIFEMYNKRILTEDCDIVIGIKLKFWPQIIQTRMNYLKYNKSHIYNKIKNATVYAIPKWSKSTDSEAAPYEFRLSFSVFESILARSRYDIEKKLNNIARRIYYRYIKKQDSSCGSGEGTNNIEECISSYVVKTCVLWMCEMYDLKNDYKNVNDEQEISRDLFKRFINFFRERLETKLCQHYFIEQINLLSSYNSSTITRSLDALNNIDVKHHLKTNYKPYIPKRDFIHFTSNIVEEFHELELNHFDVQCPFYIPEKYNSYLKRLYRLFLLIIERNDRNWWIHLSTILFNKSTENQSDIIDLSNINIQEIIDCLVTFVNNVQRRWPIIKYLIFENDSMKEFVIEKRHMFVKYGIKFCEQFIYDDTLGYLKQNCFSETLQTNIKHSKQIDYPYDEYNRPIQCSITLKKSEQTEKEEELSILIPIDVLFDEFWNGNFPYLVDHVLVLSTAGYLITKFIFATDKYYQESNPVRSKFMPCLRIIKLIRSILEIRRRATLYSSVE